MNQQDKTKYLKMLQYRPYLNRKFKYTKLSWNLLYVTISVKVTTVIGGRWNTLATEESDIFRENVLSSTTTRSRISYTNRCILNS